MNLDRVTITGADDSIDPQELARLAKDFPFVEWAILLSSSQEGGPRFPSLDWMLTLQEVAKLTPMRLAGHLCGRWVRDLCLGGRVFELERAAIARMFQRIQINFHGERHRVSDLVFAHSLKVWERDEYVIQFDNVNNETLAMLNSHGVRAVPLFDLSSGAGVEPASWPAPVGDYCGYAGGLHPDKIGQQLMDIERAAGRCETCLGSRKVSNLSGRPQDRVTCWDCKGSGGGARVWIDVETHVRSDGDQQFDLQKVRQFLARCASWIGS